MLISLETLNLKVKDSEELDENKTILRLNAARFGIRGTEENLGTFTSQFGASQIFWIFWISVYKFEDLLISVGGYLGLFIGVSLMDVNSFITELIDSIFSKTLENSK